MTGTPVGPWRAWTRPTDAPVGHRRTRPMGAKSPSPFPKNYFNFYGVLKIMSGFGPKSTFLKSTITSVLIKLLHWDFDTKNVSLVAITYKVLAIQEVPKKVLIESDKWLWSPCIFVYYMPMDEPINFKDNRGWILEKFKDNWGSFRFYWFL